MLPPRHLDGPAQIVYPQIPPISADLNMLSADSEKESAEICGICG
jgi:hypothetical protein